MIYTKDVECIKESVDAFKIGDRIIATCGDYAGLKGNITEIRTGADKETENETDDIYCSFDFPNTETEIQLLEKHFSGLFGEKKTRDDICLDLIIMAPDEIRRLDENE